MKTTLPNGREHTFSFSHATGFVSGDTISVDARDLNAMVETYDCRPEAFFACLHQLRSRFPENRVGGKLRVKLAALRGAISDLDCLGEHDLAQACIDALDTWEEDQKGEDT